MYVYINLLLVYVTGNIIQQLKELMNIVDAVQIPTIDGNRIVMKESSDTRTF